MSSSSLHPALRRWLHSFIPAPVTVRWSERVRSAAGALVGILFTGTMMKMVPGASTLIPLLVAPMGASAVLLFAVPASPLAQPWSRPTGSIKRCTRPRLRVPTRLPMMFAAAGSPRRRPDAST